MRVAVSAPIGEQDVAELREPEGIDQAEHDARDANTLIVAFGVDGEDGVGPSSPALDLRGEQLDRIGRRGRRPQAPADDLRVGVEHRQGRRIARRIRRAKRDDAVTERRIGRGQAREPTRIVSEASWLAQVVPGCAEWVD